MYRHFSYHYYMENEKQKILYIITKSNFGGAQRYVYELATRLPRASYDVTVAFGGNGLLKQKLEEAGIQTRSIHSFDRDINIIKELKSIFELATIIREIKPDVIHLNSSKAGGSGAFVARLLGIKKIVFTAHGWPFHENRNLLWKSIVWFLSWLTSLLAHVTILVSQYDKSSSRMPFVQNKFTLIRTAVPNIDFLTREVSRQKLFTQEIQNAHMNDIWLVTTAELTPNKNILTAIKAVETYNRENSSQKIFYTIISDGELFSALKEYIHTHNLENEIYLAGYVPEARTYLKAFDIFLLPSVKEGMPYTVLEAGAAGLPSIASNVGGIPEIISNTENGILVNPHDQKTIEAALQSYSTNPSLRAEHSQKLKSNVNSSFALNTMIEKTIAIYTA